MATPVFLNTLERTGLSTWIRETESVFGYYFVLVFHNIGLALLVGSCAVIAFRLLGFVPQLPLRPLRRLFLFVWIGFWLNVVSGIFLLIAYPTKALTNPIFYLKLTLIGVGIVLAGKIRVYVTGGTVGATDSAPSALRRLATVSLLVWVAVITTGRLLAYTCSRLTVDTSCQ